MASNKTPTVASAVTTEVQPFQANVAGEALMIPGSAGMIVERFMQSFEARKGLPHVFDPIPGENDGDRALYISAELRLWAVDGKATRHERESRMAELLAAVPDSLIGKGCAYPTFADLCRVHFGEDYTPGYLDAMRKAWRDPEHRKVLLRWGVNGVVAWKRIQATLSSDEKPTFYRLAFEGGRLDEQDAASLYIGAAPFRRSGSLQLVADAIVAARPKKVVEEPAEGGKPRTPSGPAQPGAEPPSSPKPRSVGSPTWPLTSAAGEPGETATFTAAIDMQKIAAGDTREQVRAYNAAVHALESIGEAIRLARMAATYLDRNLVALRTAKALDEAAWKAHTEIVTRDVGPAWQTYLAGAERARLDEDAKAKAALAEPIKEQLPSSVKK